MRRSSFSVPPAALLALLAAAGCHKAADEKAAEVKPVAQVRTATVSSSQMAQTVLAYGAGETPPGAEHSLTAPVEARVAQVLASAGSVVAAGQPLALLSPSPQTQLDLQKAIQDSTASSAAYARAQRLRVSGLVGDAEVETTRAASVTAVATLAALRARLTGLVLRAPVGGVVEAITASPGDLVAQGAAVAKVGSVTSVIVRVGVEPATARALRVGLAARVEPLQGGAGFSGSVASVDLRVDPTTRLASVVITGAAAGTILPGQPVRAEITVGRSTGEAVPRGALYYEADQPYVLVVRAGVAHKADVKLGAEKDGTVEVVGGLAGGDRIVIDGGASLDDGAAVREAPAPPEGASAEPGAGA